MEWGTPLSRRPHWMGTASVNDLNQAVLGVLTAFLLGFIVFGSTALAMVENASPLAALPTQIMDIGRPLLPTLSVAQVEEALPELTLPGQPLPEQLSPEQLLLEPPLQVAPEVAANLPAIGETYYPEAHCPAPAGWSAYILQPDDSIESVSLRFGLAPEEFSRYNCLIVKSLVPGSRVYVPMIMAAVFPTATMTAEAVEIDYSQQATKRKELRCGPPAWWVTYIIRRGDTLFGLSLSTGASVAELQFSNCMGSSTILRVGQPMYVPRSPVSLVKPSATFPPSATPASPTPLPSKTLTPPYGTPRATSTSVPPRPTTTATSTATLTQEPTGGLPPTATTVGNIPPTSTQVPPTNTPSDTPLPTNTPRPTDTPAPTNSPLPPTETPLPPTNTSMPPTDTPLPPTDIPIPPTDTPPPPTDIPLAPTDTPAPQADTPTAIVDTQAARQRIHRRRRLIRQRRLSIPRRRQWNRRRRPYRCLLIPPVLEHRLEQPGFPTIGLRRGIIH
jgi:hypothetical protein